MTIYPHIQAIQLRGTVGRGFWFAWSDDLRGALRSRPGCVRPQAAMGRIVVAAGNLI